jgi:hypothetical protein
MNEEVNAILADIAQKLAGHPVNSPADDLLISGLERLIVEGIPISEAKDLLRSRLLGSSVDVSLERRDGEESVGDAITLKELSLVKVLC